ncbi:hypothetical protein [Nocardioides caldifontis]|uniref:hypothetical protein n=1 Tax=Nocardioides caldifontis TaxID=2588938 RepID=UPI001939D054|nr:hypothetical protein [Nocardioides caldifontis]
MKKYTALLLIGIGYVLGARAGRERYEQIRGFANKVQGNPTVQQTASKAADVAKDKAPVVKEKLASVASSGSDDTGSNGVPMEGSAYPRSDSDAKG